MQNGGKSIKLFIDSYWINIFMFVICLMKTVIGINYSMAINPIEQSDGIAATVAVNQDKCHDAMNYSYCSIVAMICG